MPAPRARNGVDGEQPEREIAGQRLEQEHVDLEEQLIEQTVDHQRERRPDEQQDRVGLLDMVADFVALRREQLQTGVRNRIERENSQPGSTHLGFIHGVPRTRA